MGTGKLETREHLSLPLYPFPFSPITLFSYYPLPFPPFPITLFPYFPLRLIPRSTTNSRLGSAAESKHHRYSSDTSVAL